MTSIEWLWEQIDGIIPYQDIKTSQLFNGVLEQAKEMHKQEIIKFANDFSDDCIYCSGEFAKEKSAEEYYQETFVSNKKIKFNEEEWSKLNNESKGSYEVEVPQQEILDEEIENEAKVWASEDLIISRHSFVSGAKWYREQLKQKQ